MATVHNPTDHVIKFMYDNGLGETPGACPPGETIEVAYATIEDASGELEITEEEEVVVEKPSSPNKERKEPDYEDVHSRSKQNKDLSAKRDARQSDPRT